MLVRRRSATACRRRRCHRRRRGRRVSVLRGGFRRILGAQPELYSEIVGRPTVPGIKRRRNQPRKHIYSRPGAGRTAKGGGFFSRSSRKMSASGYKRSIVGVFRKLRRAADDVGKRSWQRDTFKFNIILLLFR